MTEQAEHSHPEKKCERQEAGHAKSDRAEEEKHRDSRVHRNHRVIGLDLCRSMFDAAGSLRKDRIVRKICIRSGDTEVAYCPTGIVVQFERSKDVDAVKEHPLTPPAASAPP